MVSALQNIPKFFEFKVRTQDLHSSRKAIVYFPLKSQFQLYFLPQLVNNNTDFWSTSLGEDEDYIRFSGWWDELFVTGLAPFLALVYFNIRIYMKIRASTNYRYRFICHPHFKRRRLQNRQNSNIFGKTNSPNISSYGNPRSSATNNHVNSVSR